MAEAASADKEARRRARLARNAAQARAEPTFTASELSAFDKADRRRADPLRRDAADRAIAAIEARVEARREQHWRDQAIGETVALAEAAGAVVTRRADGGAVRELGPGLGWLMRKGRLAPDQLRAAKRYQDDHADAGASMRSCLDDFGAPGGFSGLPPPMTRATVALRAARDAVRDPAMLAILDQVCGMGFKLTELAKGDDREALVLEERLKCALNLLVWHYGVRAAA